MLIRGSHKSNCAVKVTMIIPRKEAQTIRLSRLKGFKSSRPVACGERDIHQKGVFRDGEVGGSGDEKKEGTKEWNL